jgi:hypothetical protein
MKTTRKDGTQEKPMTHGSSAPGPCRSDPDRESAWQHRQSALGSPERIFDIAIISKVPLTFARVMFAPAILESTRQLADDFKEEIAQLRIIARDTAVTAELWLRSKHGTWRFFLVTPNSLVEIDSEGKPFLPGSGQTIG